MNPCSKKTMVVPNLNINADCICLKKTDGIRFFMVRKVIAMKHDKTDEKGMLKIK
jgi:hypothetical protein